MTRDYLHVPGVPIKPELFPFRHMSELQLAELTAGVDLEHKRRNAEVRRATQIAKHLRYLAKQAGNAGAESGVWTKKVSLSKVPSAIPEVSFLTSANDRKYMLSALLLQDWSYLFSECDPAPRYYVYAHVDPFSPMIKLPKSCGGLIHTPFYIGKGVGERAFNLNRNQGHGIKLRRLINNGASQPSIVQILCRDLTEQKAFELEAKLVYFFGRIYDQEIKGTLLNLDPCPRPVFTQTIPTATSLKAPKKPKYPEAL